MIALIFCISWLEIFLWATSPSGKPDLLAMFTIWVIMFSVLSLAGIFLGFLILLIAKYRYVGIVLIISSVIFLSSMWFFGGVIQSVQEEKFYQMIARAQVMIDAIDSYEKRNGSPPSDLNDLIPDYLSKIPGTGVGAFPEFFYSNGKDYYTPGGWLLAVQIGVIPFDWQALEYRPGYVYAEGVPRYGKWALVAND